MLSSSPGIDCRLAAAAAASEDPQFFDVQLSGLDALEHYCRSHLAFQRLAYGQGIAAAALATSYVDCVEVLLPLVEYLARDAEPEIRGVAVQQIVGLGHALHQKDTERSLRDIEGSLLVTAQHCAVDDEEEVAQAAVLAFQDLSALLPVARATAASKRAVDRLEARGSDEAGLAAVRLLAHTVGSWTGEALRRHVPRYANRWANHRDFAIREALATCMSLIVAPMPLQLSHQLLLPFFHQLCRDSNWRVRRACALDLPRLAHALQQQHGQQQQPQTQQQTQAQDAAPSGCCSSKASSCLRTLRLSSELGSRSCSSLLAGPGGGMHGRNRSASCLTSRPAATPAQIMTKHPMHSSLITDALLASPATSAPASPTSSAPATPGRHSEGLAAAVDELQEQPQVQPPAPAPAPHSRFRPDSDAGGAGGSSGCDSDDAAAAPDCAFERGAPLLHDCWCALRQCSELLTADSSHWVKVAALSGLGPFLLLLPGCQLGPLLLGRFTAMAGSTVVIYEISVALSCAQHFGRLAQRLGQQHWHDMRDAWHALQASRDPAVLCELVAALPGLIRVLGPAITAQELLPSLGGLLASHLSWVSAQLVACMAELLELLPHTGHEMLLKVLSQLVAASGERSRTWRLRRDLALQLGRMATAAGPEAISDSLWPAAMTLCCDPVAAVRNAAAGQVGALLAAVPAPLLQQHERQGSGCSELCCSTSGCCCSGAGSPREALQAGSQDCQLANGGIISRSGSSSSSSKQRVRKQLAWQDSSAAADAASGSDDADDAEVPLLASRGSSASSAASTGQRRTPSFSSLVAASGPDAATLAAVRLQLFGSESVSDHHSMHQRGPGGSGYTTAAPGISSGGRSSLEYELELPSALAPAPVEFVAPAGAALQQQPGSKRADVDSTSPPHANGGIRGSSSSSCSSSDEDADDGSDSGSDSDSSSGSDDEAPPANGWRGGAQQQSAAVAQPPQQQQQQQQQRPALLMHPAMMPVGSYAPRQAKPSPSKPPPSKARSTGDLLKVSQAAAAMQLLPYAGRRTSSFSERPSPAGSVHEDSSDSGDDSVTALPSSNGARVGGGLPADPAGAAPHQYLRVLLQHFGCSAHHHQRQLFVPLVVGVLVACHERLSCGQQAALLDRLEALATDEVPGVRYAVAAALHGIRQQAQELQLLATDTPAQQQDVQPQQPASPRPGSSAAAGAPAEDKQQQQQQHLAACVSDDMPAASPFAGQLERRDSYAAYVQELAECSQVRRSSSMDAASATPDALLAGAGSPRAQLMRTQAQAQQPAVEAAQPGAAWLIKLRSCEQLERLMSVAVTTGPL